MQQIPTPQPQVSADGHFFIDTANGDRPFFYLADTVWMLFSKLRRDEIEQVLRDRAAKGFTAIQACVFRDLFEPNTPNAEGLLPFATEEDLHAARLNPAWLDLVDEVVARADELSLNMALLPTWGDKWNEESNSAGPVIMDRDKAHTYGRTLSDRLARHRNIIWVMGGDSPIRRPEHLAILDAMAAGIRAGGAGDRLMTFHPTGGATSELLHTKDWLDFHGLQSGHHHLGTDDYTRIESMYALMPPKPCLNIEPNYELAPMFISKRWGSERAYEPVFSAYDVRKCLYRSVLAGGAGFTYGCDPIRQCHRPGDRLHVHDASPMPTWDQALAAPGSSQLRFFVDLLTERSYFSRRPAQHLLRDLNNKPINRDSLSNHDPFSHIQVAACSEGRYLMAYLPIRRHLIVDTSKLSGERFTVSVYHPAECRLHQRFDWPNSGRFLFTPEWDLDCFVVLDAAAS